MSSAALSHPTARGDFQRSPQIPHRQAKYLVLASLIWRRQWNIAVGPYARSTLPQIAANVTNPKHTALIFCTIVIDHSTDPKVRASVVMVPAMASSVATVILSLLHDQRVFLPLPVRLRSSRVSPLSRQTRYCTLPFRTRYSSRCTSPQSQQAR
jgi:hypothetical protein